MNKTKTIPEPPKLLSDDDSLGRFALVCFEAEVVFLEYPELLGRFALVCFEAEVVFFKYPELLGRFALACFEAEVVLELLGVIGEE
jgi:uncharacterized protein (DUF488 family)